MKTKHLPLALLLSLTCASTLLWVACDDSSNAVKEPAPGAEGGPAPTGTPTSTGTGLPDAGKLPDGAPADCYTNPTTHFEIINACTTAQKVTKNPTLPLLYPDGGLPPTP